MATTARDVMQTHLIKVSPEAPLIEVHRLFVDEEINGAPVVDDEDRLQGVISSMDLLRAVEEEHDTAAVEQNYFRDFLEFSGPDWQRSPEDFQDRLSDERVEAWMTRNPATVAPETPISEVAALMRRTHIHRVFVVEDGVLLGLISTFDLIGLLEKP